MVKVKICGFTREADLEVALESGVDLVGFVRHPSSARYLPPNRVQELAERVPESVSVVEVFHKTEPSVLENGYVQGFEIDNLAPQQELIQVVRVGKPYTLHPQAKFLLIDSATEKLQGGTGLRVDWDIAAELVKNAPLPVFLAGGLTPENVREAIEKVRPYGVDVSSGVEIAPGVKDHKKVRDFLLSIRN